MPAYNYVCISDCKHPDDESYDLIWEVTHGMMEDPKVVCPLCGGEAQKTFRGVQQVWYIKGNCYLDKAGAKRDMDLHTMKYGEDPFGEHREAGEADHIMDTLERGGKQLKRNKEIIYTTKEESTKKDNSIKLYNPDK